MLLIETPSLVVDNSSGSKVREADMLPSFILLHFLITIVPIFRFEFSVMCVVIKNFLLSTCTF